MYDLSKYDERFGKYISISTATSADASQMFDAQIGAFPDDPANLSLEEINDAIDDSDYKFFVATYKGEFAGYFALHSKRLRPWINGNSLVVLDEYAGRAVGAYLMREGMLSTKRLFMRIFVEKMNKKALKLYDRLGFFKIGHRDNHYENGDDAVVMCIYTR